MSDNQNKKIWSGQCKMQVSQEEYDLRWNYQTGKCKLTDEQFKKKIKEIRQRTGKP